MLFGHFFLVQMEESLAFSTSFSLQVATNVSSAKTHKKKKLGGGGGGALKTN